MMWFTKLKQRLVLAELQSIRFKDFRLRVLRKSLKQLAMNNFR